MLVLAAEVAAVLVLTVTAAAIVAPKSDDRMALFVSFAHVTYGTYIAPPLDVLLMARQGWSPLLR